jgi:phosphoglycerate kinase
MQQLRTIADLGDLRGRRVLVRVDANVSMVGSRVRDDAKLRAVLPTIVHLREMGGRLVLMSHLGTGARGETLRPAATHLARLLGIRRSIFCSDRVGSTALARRIARLRDGDLMFLENLRRYPGEETNDAGFARNLAALGDVYVNDAFAVSHRTHASVVGVTRYVPAAAGILLLREVEVLAQLLEAPKSPCIALMGGAKITTKLPVITRLLRVADAVLVGGALVNHFLAAQGYAIGASFVELSGVSIARRLLRTSSRRKLILPVDVVVGRPKGTRASPRVVAIGAQPHTICGPREAILDIGPATIRAFSARLRSAATVVWNGPMGTFERPPFHHGSVALARVIASRSSGRAFGVVGGGETLAILALTGMARYIDHVSTGGGAMLAFLAGDRLPGLAPLVRS